ncbi:MAG: hypothetical protein ACRD4P_05880 [Bryobacteraceae bacterium]
MNPTDKRSEYVMITTSQGGVASVEPSRPDTKTALDVGKSGSLIDAINKMAEYGYRLLEGTVLVTQQHLSGSDVTVFMYREMF